MPQLMGMEHRSKIKPSQFLPPIFSSVLGYLYASILSLTLCILRFPAIPAIPDVID